MRVVLRGRSAELTAAFGPLRRAERARQGGVLLVTGEPGIGKSALLAAVAAEASARGFRVGATAGPGAGLAPLLSALRSGPDPLLSAAELAELAELAPVLMADRVAGRLAELAGPAGTGAPLLIVVDDLPMVSREGRVTLRALAARLTGAPVVWALGSRRASREFLAGLDEAGPHGVRVEWVRLGPLPRPEVAALARDRLGREPDGALRRMLAGSGGNPRLAVAVLDGLAQAAARGEPTDRIPSVLVRTVRRVLTGLGPGPRELTELAVVLDRPMTVSEACALLPGQAEAEVTRAIDVSIAAGLLRGSGPAVRPRFGLIREAIYGDLPGLRRAALHLRCGQLLLATGGDPRAAAAHARAAAGDGRAAEAALISRQAAAGLVPGDPSAAARVITDLRRSISSNDAGLEATVQDTDLLLRAQHDRAALEVADLGLARTDDPAARATLQILAARALIALGRPGEAQGRILAAARPGGPAMGPVRARLDAAEARALAACGPEEVTRAAAARALVAARATGDRPAEVLAVEALAEASRRHGRAAEALRQGRVLRQLAGPGHPAQLAREIFALQQADRLTDAGLLLAAAGPAAASAPSLVEARLWQQLAAGQLAEAAGTAAALAELGRELGSPPYRELGGQAADVIAWLRGEAGALLVRPTGPELRAARERGAPWLWQPGAMRLVAQAGLAAGDRDLAGSAAAVAEAAAARNPGLAVTGGLARQVRGLVHGDTSLLGRAWELLRDSPRPLVRAGAAQDYGAALLAGPGAGSRAAGVRLLDEAREMFGQIGAAGPQRAVELALRRAGKPARAAPPGLPAPTAGWDSLTAAERKVAELVSSGYTNRATASQLGLSPNTIGTHVRSIFSKLHIQSRVQLANLRHETQPPGPRPQSPARILRAVWAISALVKACPSMPHPPSGASEISTQVRSVSDGSPAAAATISVISRTTPSFLSRSRTPTGVSTPIRT
ncbi:MAG TPA: AAA family ATPase [Streptosporangiaceae bacterium]|nr:AAA family ATPase [Streptosporangiaceae bacterium]